MGVATLFLTSLGFTGFGPWLEGQGIDAPVAVVTNASRGLSDGTAIVALAEAELHEQGIATHRVNVLAAPMDALAHAGAIVMTGGNPFLLLEDLKQSGADRALLAAHADGVAIAGQSAGAIVCGPSLEPVTLTSPFAPQPNADLRGLGLLNRVVLPHQDRTGRAALHRRAALAFAATHALTVLWDDEVLLPELDVIVRAGQWTRRARLDDAPAVARVFHEASREAWSPFIPPERLADAGPDTAAWAQRIRIGGHRFLVTEDDRGIIAFVYYRQAADEGGAPIGEVDMLYTHPRAWGCGVGRRLLERATWRLLCEGFREAVLWTESRNQRAIAVYRQNGWAPDGAVDEREYLGTPIRNRRYRLDLTQYAGGA